MIAKTITTMLLLFPAAVYAAQPADTGRFTVQVAATKVYLLSDRKVEYIGKRVKSVPPAVYVHWRKFVEVLDMDMPPKDGVFNVNGQPIAPTVEFVGRRGAVATFMTPAQTFDICFKSPGRCVLRAAVGRAWSRDVTIEVVQLPIWNGMPTAELLERCGFPDKKQTVPGTGREFWLYDRWPGALILIGHVYSSVGEVTQSERLEPDIRRRLRDMNPFAKVEKERTP